jgi:hypothetical protein
MMERRVTSESNTNPVDYPPLNQDDTPTGKYLGADIVSHNLGEPAGNLLIQST